MVPIFELLVSFGMVFFSCELAGRLSNKFDEICAEFEQIDWYLLPLKMQRIFPFVLQNAQESVDFECFGSIPCDRSTFKRVGWLTVLVNINVGYAPISFFKSTLFLLRRWSIVRSHILWFSVNLINKILEMNARELYVKMQSWETDFERHRSTQFVLHIQDKHRHTSVSIEQNSIGSSYP